MDQAATDPAVRCRVGIVVPPENPTVEPEVRALLPAAMEPYTMRLPVVDGDLKQRLHAYNASLREVATGFGGMDLRAIYLACTGSSYLVGPDDDAALEARLGVGDAVPLTAARAIRTTLAKLGRDRIRVVSPYPSWLTEAAVAFWTDAGLDVAGVSAVPAPGGIYAITTGQVVDHLRSLDVSQGDVVVLSGTGMPTAWAIAEIGASLGVPVISSALAAAFTLTDLTGHRGGLAQELMAAAGL